MTHRDCDRCEEFVSEARLSRRGLIAGAALVAGSPLAALLPKRRESRYEIVVTEGCSKGGGPPVQTTYVISPGDGDWRATVIGAKIGRARPDGTYETVDVPIDQALAREYGWNTVVLPDAAYDLRVTEA